MSRKESGILSENTNQSRSPDNAAIRSEKLLLIGIIGCLLYVIGDFLFAATGKEQSTESIGFMVRVAYLEMGTWRMVPRTRERA